MKRMVSRLTIGITAMIVLFLSCCNNEHNICFENPDAAGSYINISFKVEQTEMNEVRVRSVDPDGHDINTMTLFCFNAYGLFLTTVSDVKLILGEANENGYHTSGSYTADIPKETSIIHFVGNQNAYYYQDKDFVNKTEAQVLGDMEGASGMMIYWARFAKDETSNDDFKTQLANEEIMLIRNQAKVTIDNWNATWAKTDEHEAGSFTVTGYVVTNIHAFGTVAPFCSAHGFAIHEWPSNHVSITLPENKAMMSDITDINTKSEDYIFEHENTLDNPVSVIIKGKHNGQGDDLYYRVMMMNDEGEMIPILRNYHYKLNIKGPLSYGKPTFEEALEGPATNNVWVAVDSWVKEVADDNYKLYLPETSKVFQAVPNSSTYSFKYKLTRPNGSPDRTITEPIVTWLDGNNVAYHEFIPHYNSETGEGTIAVTLYPDDPTTSEQTGTLMIRKGSLYRTIDISMISKQKFTPSWIAAQVYGENTGERVTLKFTIPETCPSSLFPFPVMITVNDLDVRASSGVSLPVRLESEASWYGEPNDVGYKYEYIVDKPGVHRLYFQTLLPHQSNETEAVTVEANFFEKLTKEVIFANHNRAITVEGLKVYDENILGDAFAEDEPIKYILVPQKKNAPVSFSMKMMDLGKNIPINATSNDEFLLYSKTLNYGKEVDMGLFGLSGYDCTFYEVDESYWSTSTNGRVMMFKPNNPDKTETDKGHYHIYMKTNRPKSVDVIRISSNRSGQKSAIPNNGEYTGESYRSTIFELSNYRPFRFAAKITGMCVPDEYKDSYKTDEEEVESEVLWNYAAPGQPINISFDVTSFQSITDKTSVHPFGTEFKIYIDAPMLDIDDARRTDLLTDEKFYYDEKENRFVYVVNADRNEESKNGVSEALNKDLALNNEQQAKERKLLPFKTKNITGAGEITISSDKDIVVFYDKTFKVKNNLIEGTIKYNDGQGEPKNVPKDAFVAFVRKLTNTRIGAMTIDENGKYTLNLRKEYTFFWTDDEIEFNYKDKESKIVYDFQIESLDALMKNPNIVLKVATSTVDE